MFVLDSHCDTPSQIHRLRDLRKDNPRAQVDFPKLKRGGVDGAFFAIYVPASLGDGSEGSVGSDVKKGSEATEYARTLLCEVRACIDANSDIAALATNASEALRNQSAGLFSIFLGIENASAVGNSTELLREFRDAGVRYVTLTHSADNLVCDSCSGRGRWGGLSAWGRELLREMERLGVLPDVSHASDESIRDVLRCCDGPVVATHSSCRKLADHRRNLSDGLIRDIAHSGGCIQLNPYPPFVDSAFAARFAASGLDSWADSIEEAFIADPSSPHAREAWFSALARLEEMSRPSVSAFVDHIEHAVDLVGVEHVGIGTDLDGISITLEGLEDVSHFPLIFNELRKRGVSGSDIAAIAGGNFLRLL